ncbi:MAG: PQQ-binding-like beta-propeller repeat protein [Alphaproteobacteria bacterium]|nr:PQQ-binding-like beta-propeller repeat protein [Alphaproteobacteria bacterium]
MIRLLAFLPLLALAACSGWFGGDSEKPLPGERISVMTFERALEPDPGLSDLAVRLPKPLVNADWPQAGGMPNHAMHHLSAKGPLVKQWSVDIGDGSDSETQLLVQPVIADGRIYTLDVEAELRAWDAGTGERLWTRELKPEDDNEGILGAGLAYSHGRLFVTTGFADVIALDAADGKEIWRRRVNGPMRTAPTVFGGRIYVVTVANELHALDTANGAPLWNHVGITEVAGLLGGASPAVDGATVVAAFSSGELVALRAENGREIWSDSLTALRRFDPISTIAHIRGRPVIDGGQVIATANSGRTVAIDLRTGNRVWERATGSSHSPWVVGDFVYLMNNAGELVCLARRNGGIRWVRQMQVFEDEKDREDPIVWTGPVLAGDRLLVGSSHGELWSVSPYTGKLLGRIETPGPVFIPPAVANDTVYVLTDKAELIAFR